MQTEMQLNCGGKAGEKEGVSRNEAAIGAVIYSLHFAGIFQQQKWSSRRSEGVKNRETKL
jgi:hypothetical protein